MTGGHELADASGVPHAELLVRFAEALVERDELALVQLREAISAALGPAGLHETASIASNFQRMVRIADATGIPQDASMLMLGEDLVEELDLRRFGSADNSPRANALQRLLGRLLRPIAPGLLKRVAGRSAS